jgi:predicted permease
MVARWEERLARIPGVDRVAIARYLPVYGYSNTARFAIDGRPDAPMGREPFAYTPAVTPGYFETLGLRLIEGRGFTAEDRIGAPLVTVINETMARTLWPGESPLGKRIGSLDPANRNWREIVGVVGDARSALFGEVDAPFQMYRPWAQAPDANFTIALRTRVAPESVAPELRRAAAEIDPGQPVYSIVTARAQIDRSFLNLELAGWWLVGFAALGVLLAALGIYAVIANSVIQRTHEIGIRMALGAQVSDVLALVVGHGLRLAIFGTLVGLAGAWGIARLLAAIMPAVPAANALSVVATTSGLLAVALLACWLPARRAARVDPMTALRAE